VGIGCPLLLLRETVRLAACLFVTVWVDGVTDIVAVAVPTPVTVTVTVWLAAA
jgi:hypothetical protein